MGDLQVPGAMYEFYIPGLVNIQKAIEHGHWNSEFSHEKWWFSIDKLVSQRVYIYIYILLKPLKPTCFFVKTLVPGWYPSNRWLMGVYSPSHMVISVTNDPSPHRLVWKKRYLGIPFVNPLHLIIIAIPQRQHSWNIPIISLVGKYAENI